MRISSIQLIELLEVFANHCKYCTAKPSISKLDKQKADELIADLHLIKYRDRLNQDMRKLKSC